MAARLSAKRLPRYSLDFKLKAVKLTRLPGIEVQAVAEALDIHPVMLSRWRQEAREGRLREVAPRAQISKKLVREIKRLQDLEQAHRLLQEEHELLKKPSGSAPSEGGHLRVHRTGTGSVRGKAAVRFVRSHPRGVLRVADPDGKCQAETGPGIVEGHSKGLRGESRHVRQPTRASGAQRPGLRCESTPH